MISKKLIYLTFDKRQLNISKYKIAVSSFKIFGSFSIKERFSDLVDKDYLYVLKKNENKKKKRSFKLKSSFKDEKTFSIKNNDTKETEFKVFFNQCFDKGRLKNFVLWFLAKYGENKTIYLVEHLKNIGFYYASKAGISLGIDDLKIPPKKATLIYDAEKLTSSTINQYMRGEITGVERFQRLIDTWHRTSEILKQEVIDHFEATDILNPVYMMAFSGARGNISQVRQLVGMRGLMADPQGQILDFPIRSNFREGLTLTEYIISSYGARKGIVDTALRTANAGYLTRRLVDVAQHVIVSNFDCGTKRGIFLTNMKEGNKIIYSLHQRIVGRILARDLFLDKKIKIASRNEEVTPDLAFKIGKNFDKVFVRSSLTCEKLICQLCYGWSLAQGKLVSIGEAVGVVAAQSIGEPGTQLTMRTFHTGGVFSGDISDQIKAPYNGIIEYISSIPGTLIRTPEGKISFLTKSEGSFVIYKLNTDFSLKSQQVPKKLYKIPPYTLLYMRNGQNVLEKEVVAQISSISQKTNATDDAELTIKSDIEGQFYSKSVNFREKMVGPKLKKSNDLGFEKFDGFEESGQLDPNLLSNSNSFFHNLEYDKLYEAWTWGYAWILSGKIYEFKKPSLLFPIIGDFVNTKSYITQIKWNLNNNNPSNYRNFKDNSLIQVCTNINNHIFEFKRRTPSNSHLELVSNSHILQQHTISDQPLTNPPKCYFVKTSQVLLLDLNNIFFKKYGYIFELTKKSQFISFAIELNQTIATARTSTVFSTDDILSDVAQSYISQRRKKKEKKDGFDLLFFLKVPSVSNFNIPEKSTQLKKVEKSLSFKNNYLNIKNQKNVFDFQNQKQEKDFESRVTKREKRVLFNNKRYLEFFPYILQWHPNTYNTKTPGIAIFDIPYFNLSDTSGLHKNESCFMEQRLYYLKKREIETSKILWLPFLIFKVSNLITSFNFMQLDSYYLNEKKNINLSNSYNNNVQLTEQKERKYINDLNQFMSLFLNKKIKILQINRQGNIYITNHDFIDNNNHNHNLINNLENKQSYFYKPFGLNNNLKNKKEVNIINSNLPSGLEHVEDFFVNKNAYYGLSQQITTIPSILLKIKKSIFNKPNQILYDFFFRKRFNILTHKHKDKGKNMTLVYKNLIYKLNIYSYNQNYKFTTLKSYSKLVQSFIHLDHFDKTKYELTEKERNGFSFLFNVFEEKTNYSNTKKRVYKDFLIKQNRSFIFLKSIHTISFSKKSVFDARQSNMYSYNGQNKSIYTGKDLNNVLQLSNFLEKNYKQFSFIKNKNKFYYFLNKELNYNYSNRITNIDSNLNLTNKYIHNNFVLRSKPSYYYFFNYFIPPYQSSLITKSSFYKSASPNKFNDIKQPINNITANSTVHTTLKKGWVFITTSSFKVKNLSVFLKMSKKVIYPGDILFNNLTFSLPIFVECLLLNPVFNIRNISSLSIKNLPNFNSINFNSNNGTKSHYNNKDFENLNLTTEELNNFNIKIMYNDNNDYHNSNFQMTNRYYQNNQNNQKSNFISIDPLDLQNNIESIKFDQRYYISKYVSNKDIELKNLYWVKNKKSRFFIEETDLPCSGQKSQINISSKNKTRIHNSDLLIGFLFQPIQELEQMSKLDLKKYVYESNKTTYNISNVENINQICSPQKQLFSFSQYMQAINSILDLDIQNRDFFIFAMKKSNEGKMGLKRFLINLKKSSYFNTFYTKYRNSNYLKKNKIKREVFINQSFDSLSKKRLYKTKLSKSSMLSRQSLLKFSPYQQKNIIINNGQRFNEVLEKPFTNYLSDNFKENFFHKNELKIENIDVISNKYNLFSSLMFLLKQSSNLMKSIFLHSNLFTNKTFFRRSDWKIIGLLQNKIDSSYPSSLFPKSSKDDFTIISNILINNYMQQYNNFEELKSFDFLSIPFYRQKIRSISIVSRKSLNLSPFLINYKNLANLPTLFNKKQYFKLLYSPISSFDSILYPFLSKQFKIILNQYLLNSDVLKYKINRNENNFLFYNWDKFKEKNSSKFDIKDNKTFFYSDFNQLIQNLFESQCFYFSLTQSFDFSNINTNKNQVTEFLYNNHSFSILSKNISINKIKTNRFIVNKNAKIKQKTLSSSVTLFEAKTSFYSPFNGELIYVKKMSPSLSETLVNDPFRFASDFQSDDKILTKTKKLKTSLSEFLKQNPIDSTNYKTDLIQKRLNKKDKLNLHSSFSEMSPILMDNQYQFESLPTVPFNYGCMFLTKQNLISFYFPYVQQNFKFRDFLHIKNSENYEIKDTLIKFLTISEIESFKLSNNLANTSFNTNNLNLKTAINIKNTKAGYPIIRDSVFRKSTFIQKKATYKQITDNSQTKINYSQQKTSISLLGDFYVYGDSICDSSVKQTSVQASGQIIHYNNLKVTLRKAQPIFISPKGILHKFDGEFIAPKAPVITLSYKRLKTGDIIQGIPKVEQFFEARTTKRGRLFRDSLPSLLKALFKRYQAKMPLELAVRQSFYKIQQIIVDGVHRVYKSQGVTISDKHLEVIVKQMTSKVRILGGAQTGFFPGEVVDISFVEKINQFLIKKITYEPLVLGITKASLEVDSFLSAASFQQTTKILSQAAIYRKKDFLKGLKENVILGNLIPAGTGYLVYLDDLSTH